MASGMWQGAIFEAFHGLGFNSPGCVERLVIISGAQTRSWNPRAHSPFLFASNHDDVLHLACFSMGLYHTSTLAVGTHELIQLSLLSWEPCHKEHLI